MDVTATDFLKQATHTAEYFGFKTIDVLKKHPESKACKKKLKHTASAVDRRNDALHGMLTAGMTSFCDSKLHEIEAPVLFYTTDLVPRTGEAAITLQVFNVEKSIAEAILIHATKALASDLGFDNHSVRINSLGDRDSSVRYIRELTNYLKKRMDDMPEAARELMKEHSLTALAHLIEKDHELAYKTPNPLEYLTDKSRKHFREIIEYLDLADTQYEIDPKLIGHHECYSDALFSIDMLDEEGTRIQNPELMIKGGRYNEFVHRNTERHIPAAGAVVVLRDKKGSARAPKVKLATPSVYVVQLGFGPKITSLILVDELRKSGIHVHQNLACDSLSEQLRDAEAKGVTYTVITGQKEFVEGAVILRDMRARTQEQITTEALLTRLRRSSKVASV
ncbi:MAG: histidyl-tRNA synthetase [Patiriisocius sp.]|jgi:histidyl-tRNA synthetase